MSGTSNRDVKFNTITAHSGPIQDIAKCGYHKVMHNPATESSAIVTGTMRIAEAALDIAAMTGTSHVVAGYDFLIISGTQNSAQQFIHESKLQMTNTGTTTHIGMYKPAIDVIDGTIATLAMLDCEMSLAGINGAVTTCYSVYSPDTDKVMLQNGGLITDSVTLIDDYILDKNDSGNTFLMLAGTTKTITAPSSLPDGFSCHIMQGDANQVTIAASGGNTIFNKETQTKTGKAYAVVTLRQISSTITSLSGETGA